MALRDVLAEMFPIAYAWAALGLFLMAVFVYVLGVFAAIREHRYDPKLLNEWFVNDGVKYFAWLGITLLLNIVTFAAKQVGPDWEPFARSIADGIAGGGWAGTSIALALGWWADIRDKWARIMAGPDEHAVAVRRVKASVRPARLGEPEHRKSRAVEKRPKRPTEQVNV